MALVISPPRHVFVDLQVVEVRQLTPLGVAPRIVPQQIADGAQVENAFQQLGRLGIQRLRQRLVEARHPKFLSRPGDRIHSTR